MTKPKYPRRKSAPVYDRAVRAFYRAHGYAYSPFQDWGTKWVIGWQVGYAAGKRKRKGLSHE